MQRRHFLLRGYIFFVKRRTFYFADYCISSKSLKSSFSISCSFIISISSNLVSWVIILITTSKATCLHCVIKNHVFLSALTLAIKVSYLFTYCWFKFYTLVITLLNSVLPNTTHLLNLWCTFVILYKLNLFHTWTYYSKC